MEKAMKLTYFIQDELFEMRRSISNKAHMGVFRLEGSNLVSAQIRNGSQVVRERFNSEDYQTYKNRNDKFRMQFRRFVMRMMKTYPEIDGLAIMNRFERKLIELGS